MLGMSAWKQRTRSPLWLCFVRESKANAPLLLLPSLSLKFMDVWKGLFGGRVCNNQAFVPGTAERAEWPRPYAFPWHQVERDMLSRSREPCAALWEAAATCHSSWHRHEEIRTATVATKPGDPFPPAISSDHWDTCQMCCEEVLGIASQTIPLFSPYLTPPTDCPKSPLKLSYIKDTNTLRDNSVQICIFCICQPLKIHFMFFSYYFIGAPTTLVHK